MVDQPSGLGGGYDDSEHRDVPERWEVVASVPRFSGAVVDVRTDTVRMPGGELAERDVISHPGAVSIVALDDAYRVLLIRQYRHCAGRLMWEIPAGLLDVPEEDPLTAARRELVEEAHQEGADWRVLVDAYTSPGMSDEAIRVFLARGLSEIPDDGSRYVGTNEEAGIVVAWRPLDDVVHGVLSGALHNPHLVMGVLALNAALHGTGLDALRPASAPWPERRPPG
jgi:8-oxo-dGDP phosphatase